MLTALLAQDPTPRPAADAGPMGSPTFPFLLIGLFFLFWVVVILPQNRRQKKDQQALLSNLKRGAQVVTTSGIIGTVVNVREDGDELTLRSEDAKIKVLKSSVARVLGTEPAADAK